MLVEHVRNLWKFSAICQFVALFGEQLRIPEINIDSFEKELAVEDQDMSYLREVRLSLIKSLSSNRTINADNMDDFIRRQYTYRRVQPNPLLKVERIWRELFNGDDMAVNDNDGSELGDVEEVDEQTIITWLELTVPQRLDVLHNLCEWQLLSEKFRDRVGATTDLQMSSWRIEPIGSDSQKRLYYSLDDGRLYRCTNPATTYEKTMKKAQLNARKRKRNADDTALTSPSTRESKSDWACIASTYDQWHAVVDFLSGRSTREEKQLLDYLRDEALPYIEEIEAERHAKEAALKAKAEKAEAERVKEMLRLEALSTRKRSSRIAVLDEKRESERVRLEELSRQREMEARARDVAQLAHAEASNNIRKTREARARDRELRDYINSRPISPSIQKDNGENPEVYVSAQDTQWVNEVARHNAPSTDHEFKQNLSVIDPTMSSQMSESLPVAGSRNEGFVAAAEPDNANSSAAPDELDATEEKATIEVSAADQAWVNRKAFQMTDHVQNTVVPPKVIASLLSQDGQSQF